MEACFPLKLKRKDLEEVNDEFSDFSLASPARKIRRLDADLPPIVEEEEAEMPAILEQSMHEEGFGSKGGIGIGARAPVIEEMPYVPENDAKAIVLFKPNPLLQSPSNLSVSVNPNLISRFKNYYLWSNQSNRLGGPNDEALQEDSVSSECLAVIPWVPSQVPPASAADISPQGHIYDMMDADDMEGTKMEVEDDTVAIEETTVNEADGTNMKESLHQWQQQHCMMPQPPENRTTPVIWYR